MDEVKILGVAVNRVTMAEAVAKLAEFIRHYKKCSASGADLPPVAHVVTANSEIVMMAVDSPEMAQILAHAQLVVADGIGLVWAGRLLGQPLPERVAGIDLMDQVMTLCAREGWRPFLLGAAPGVADEAATALLRRYPGLQVAGTQHGYFGQDEVPAIIARVNQAEPDLLLVALGAPKQEKWIAAHRTQLRVPVAVGVGGSLDVWAGRAERAPRWMCDAGLEWAYRLMRQPKRALRMMALPRFAATVIWSKWRRV